MVVIHRQQFGLACFQPTSCCGGLALRTVTVATGVVGDLDLRTVLTAQHVTAEHSTAAALNRRHDLQLAKTDVSGMGLTPRRTLVAENIRDLQG